MADGAPVVLAVLPPLAARLAQQGLATITLDQAFPPA